MAVIQRLRNSGWVAVVIIVALVLFVVGDWLTGKTSGRGQVQEDADVIAEMAGEKVHEDEFMKIADEMYRKEMDQDPNYKLDEKSSVQLFQKAWTELTKRKLFQKQIAATGMEFNDADFNEMVVGPFPNESLKGDPSFQTDGQYDPQKVAQIFRQGKSNAQMKARLGDYVTNVKQQEIESRFATFYSKASYKTKTEKQYEYIAANQTLSGKMVTLDANSIKDNEVKVTNEDLEEYLNEFKEKYKIYTPSRSIKYVVFDIIPSKEDTAYITNQAQTTADNLRKMTTPDTLGAIGYLTRSQLPEETPSEVNDLVWNAPVNTVIGPIYKEGKYYIWQKVGEKKDTNAFVNASHILIPFTGTLPNGNSVKDSTDAKRIAEDVYKMVAGGKKIEELASQYSGDGGSASKGGALGWSDPSKFVKPFGDFCKTHGKGQMGIVRTEYGYHIIRMNENPDYTKIKYTQNEIEITPGQSTIKIVNDKTRKFKNLINPDKPETFEKAVEKLGLIPRMLRDLNTEQKTITGIENYGDMKSILFWLFDKKRKASDISEVFAFATKQVVMKVDAIKNEGYPTYEDVRAEIEPLVRERLKVRKCGEKLAKAFEKNKSAEKLASAVGAMTVPLDGIHFSQNFIPQLGQELPLLGALFGLKENAISVPVNGKLISAIVFMEKRQKVDVPSTVLNSVEQGDYMNQSQYLIQRIQEVLTSSAHIKDYRYKFEWYK